MVLRRGFFYCYLLLFVILAIRASEGTRRSHENEPIILPQYGGLLHQRDFHGNMAELALVHCRKLIDEEEEEEEAKQELCNCLREKKLTFHGCNGEQESVYTWLGKHLDQFFAWPSSAPRRYLVTKSMSVSRTRPPKTPLGSPASAPSPLGRGLSPEPAASPAPNAGPPAQPPILPPALLSSPPPPFAEVFLPIDVSESSPPPPRRKRSPPLPQPPSPSPPPTDKYEGQARTLAIAGTAVGVCLFVMSVMLCCVRGSGGAANRRRDEKPLLALSSSIYSGSSSRGNSAMLGSSSNKMYNNRSQKLSTLLSAKSRNNGMREGTFSSMKSGNNGMPEGTLLSMKSGNNGMREGMAPVQTPAPPINPPPTPPPPPPPPKHAAPPPPTPPPPGPAPPPPPKGFVRAPPAPPPKGMTKKPLPNAPKPLRKADKDEDAESGSQKAKLKPFFWDKAVLPNTNQSMVWNEIRSGSFQFNEEMIESLFGYNNANNKTGRKRESSASEPHYIQIIETKKAQNLGIILKALNVTTEEVVDALREGNELPVDLIATLLKVAPTSEEELKLRMFTGELSQLGPADRFLKVLVDIPFAFKRLEALLFMSSFQEESSSVKESLKTLEVACDKLRSSRLFLKLLEAVLKTGNRMNDGTYRGGAQAFRLDTLLKLSDVKGTDGKTTLLHFVMTQMIRSEGARALRGDRAGSSRSLSSVRTDDLTEDSTIPDEGSEEQLCSLGLEVVSKLSEELEDVRRAAAVDSDALTSTVSKSGHTLLKTRNFLESEMSHVDEGSEFFKAMAAFIKQAEVDVTRLLEEEKRIMALVKSTTDYFHGTAAKDEGLRVFVIVRDFLIMVDKVCREVKIAAAAKPVKSSKKDTVSARAASSENLQSLSDVRQRLFPAIAGRRIGGSDSSSSDDEKS